MRTDTRKLLPDRGPEHPLWALVVGIVLFRSPAHVERLAAQAAPSCLPPNS
jgi:hypothetical protein